MSGAIFQALFILGFFAFPFFKDLLILMYVYLLRACMQMPTGARRRHYVQELESHML